MKTKRQAQHEARRLFRLCLVEGSLDEGLVRAVVQQVIDAGRPGSLSLLTRFQRLVRLDRAAHGPPSRASRRCRPMSGRASKRAWRASTGAASTRDTPPTRRCSEACGSPWAAMSTMAAFTAVWPRSRNGSERRDRGQD